MFTQQNISRKARNGLLSGCLVFIVLACNLGNRPESTITPVLTSTTTTTFQIPPTVETPIAEITPDSQVRRLIPSVFAGNSQPLSELTNNTALALDPGGLVTTDAQGEAEIFIQGCLKLFIFQDATLERSTCRESDAASGLGVCATGGMTGVLNQCLSKIDIQTPGSNTNTTGTWFAVIYLPEDRLSIIQVYEGSVEVRAIVNTTSEQSTRTQTLEAGNLWFTAPGTETPVIDGISGREPQPMEVWGALRPALIEKYPNLDVWMESASQKASQENLAFPNFLAVPSGEVNIQLLGPGWQNERVYQAILSGVDWQSMVRYLWFDLNMTPRIRFENEITPDARDVPTDIQRANTLLSTTTFRNNYNFIRIAIVEGNTFAEEFAYELQGSLSNLDLQAEIQYLPPEALDGYLKEAAAQNEIPVIFIDVIPSNYDGF